MKRKKRRKLKRARNRTLASKRAQQLKAYYPESSGKAEAFIKILSAECLQMKEFADVQELEEFVNRFITTGG